MHSCHQQAQSGSPITVFAPEVEHGVVDNGRSAASGGRHRAGSEDDSSGGNWEMARPSSGRPHIVDNKERCIPFGEKDAVANHAGEVPYN